MPIGSDHPQVVRFGEFALDSTRMTLLRGSERLHLTGKPLEVLVFLAQNAGRTVSKRELMDAVWPGTFVTEDSLTQAVLKIRRVLGDEKGHPQFILTIPRVGYRFIGMPTVPRSVTPAAEPGATSEPARDRVRRRATGMTVALAAGLTAVVAAAALWLAGYLGSAARPEVPKASVAAPVPEEVPLPTASAIKPTFAPDGSRFLFVGYRRESPGVGDLYLASASGTGVKQLTDRVDPRGDLPVFSPDGAEVLFSRWRNGDDGTRWPDLWVVPVAGGQAHVLIEQASGAGFSADGRWIGYTKHLPGGRPLWVGPRADSSVHREVDAVGFTPRWSPDGRWLAYTTSNPEGGRGEFWLASADLSTRKRLSIGPEQAAGLAWAADSRSLVVSSDRGGTFALWRIPIDGAPRTLIAAGIGGYFSPSVSPDGGTLLFGHVIPTKNLYVSSELEGESAVELTRGQYHRWPALSPDGGSVLSVIGAPGFGNRLYLTSVGRRQTIRASDGPASYPVWVDMGHAAYLRDQQAGGTEVRFAAVAGNDDRELCRFPDPASWLAVHPDGRRLAVVLTGPDRRQRVVVRDMDGQREITLAEGSEYEHLRWIPGGIELSWSGPIKSAGPGSDGVWIAEPGGRTPRRLVPDGYNPVWSEDGARVYYSRIGTHSGLWCYDVRRSASARVRRWAEVDAFDIRGRALVFARVASDTHVFRLPLN